MAYRKLTIEDLMHGYLSMYIRKKRPETLYLSPANYAWYLAQLDKNGEALLRRPLHFQGATVLLDPNELHYSFSYASPLPNNDVCVTV